MKKYNCLLVILLLLSLSSCFSRPYDKPYGKWQSGDPEIVMDIFPIEYGESHHGTYVRNGELREIIISFAFEKAFEILDCIYVTNDVMYRDYAYFYGTFTVTKDGKLQYDLKPAYQKKTGYTTIIFEKIEEYEAPKK